MRITNACGLHISNSLRKSANIMLFSCSPCFRVTNSDLASASRDNRRRYTSALNTRDFTYYRAVVISPTHSLVRLGSEGPFVAPIYLGFIALGQGRWEAQYSTVVTQLATNLPLPTPEGWTAWSTGEGPGLNPGCPIASRTLFTQLYNCASQPS